MLVNIKEQLRNYSRMKEKVKWFWTRFLAGKEIIGTVVEF